MKKDNICFYRGFGAGIIITVMIMFLSINYFGKDESDTIKDNENTKKEETLKEETLKEIITKQGKDKIEQDQKKVDEEIKENIAEDKEKIKEEIKKEIIEELKEVAEKEKVETELVKQIEEVIIKIEYGMGSNDVAKLLMKKGLISDVKDFNSYMKIKEKVRKIQVGTFKIKINSTYDEIIEKIVS